MAITYNLRDLDWANHQGQSFNGQTGTWNPVGSVQQGPSIADYRARQQQVEDARNAFHAANPNATTMTAGQLYGVGAPNTSAPAYSDIQKNMSGWGNTTDTNAANQQWDQWQNTLAGNVGYTGPLTPNADQAHFNPGGGQLGAGNGQMPGPGTPTGDEGWFGQVDPIGGAPGNGIGTSLGALAGGNFGGSIPGQQPNFPLNIGSYLNPMMGYQLQNGINTINNGAAAAGSLNSGDTLKQLMQYGMGVSGDSFNKAAGIAQQQQGFGYGVANNDRNFAYNAANNDRNFGYQAAVGDRDYNLQRLMGMAGIGLQGAGQQGTNDRLLATLISQNMNNIGQAQGTGTMGAGNALNNAISQMLAQYMGGTVANSYLPKP